MPLKLLLGTVLRRGLHLGIGSSVEIAIGGRVHALKVAALYKSDGQHLGRTDIVHAPFRPAQR